MRAENSIIVCPRSEILYPRPQLTNPNHEPFLYFLDEHNNHAISDLLRMVCTSIYSGNSAEIIWAAVGSSGKSTGRWEMTHWAKRFQRHNKRRLGGVYTHDYELAMIKGRQVGKVINPIGQVTTDEFQYINGLDSRAVEQYYQSVRGKNILVREWVGLTKDTLTEAGTPRGDHDSLAYGLNFPPDKKWLRRDIYVIVLGAPEDLIMENAQERESRIGSQQNSTRNANPQAATLQHQADFRSMVQVLQNNGELRGLSPRERWTLEHGDISEQIDIIYPPRLSEKLFYTRISPHIIYVRNPMRITDKAALERLATYEKDLLDGKFAIYKPIEHRIMTMRDFKAAEVAFTRLAEVRPNGY